MVEEPKAEDQDLINTREYRKRNMRFIRKHGKDIANLNATIEENNISFGQLVD